MTPQNHSPHLVTTQWLEDRLDDPNLALIDASWYLPAQNRNGEAEYRKAHIPNAVFFDIDEIADKSSGLPHMLPAEAAFGAAVGAMGISADKTIVVYDGSGLFSAPRVWWMFRVFGAKTVFLLDGGFPAWLAEGRRVVSFVADRMPAHFEAALDRSQVVGIDEVKAALATGALQVVDARSAERFRGDAPEPRPGVRPGHMPGSKNLPFPNMLERGRLAPVETLTKAFVAAGIDLSKPVIASCGSGVSAAILALAFDSIDKPVKGIYDGSWSEWGALKDVPVATGMD